MQFETQTMHALLLFIAHAIKAQTPKRAQTIVLQIGLINGIAGIPHTKFGNTIPACSKPKKCG